jgi:hypothetical protein
MINSVRNTVLTILNKNNYGYISPSDFNLLAQNAQLELYEEYFSSFNKVINAENMRASGTDYADIKKTISEVLEVFLVSDYLVPKSTNNFYVPSVTTTGNESYMISKIMVYGSQVTSGTTTAVSVSQLVDSLATFVTVGVSVGDIVINTSTFASTTVLSVVGQTTLNLVDNIFLAGSRGYAIYKSANAEAEKVSNGNILNLVASNLTAPSLIYPSYTNIGDVMTLYPATIQGYGAVKADYFRYPKPPKWTYSLLSSGEPVFDQSQSDYQDFELPQEDEYKLVTKILEYCGIVIREIVVSQFGTAQQQHEQPTFSMQQ